MFINIKIKQKNMKIVCNYKNILKKKNECYIDASRSFYALAVHIKVFRDIIWNKCS